MHNWIRGLFKGSMLGAVLAASAISAVISVSVTRTTGQATRPATVDGKPNLSGIWQANNEAHWDLEAHAARAGAVMQEGIYPYAYARVPAAPVVALGAAAGLVHWVWCRVMVRFRIHKKRPPLSRRMVTTGLTETPS